MRPAKGWNPDRKGGDSSTTKPRRDRKVALPNRFSHAETLDAHLAERRRISRILHDDVGPTLSAIGFQLDALRYDVPDLAPRTAELQRFLEAAMERIRALSQELSPSLVDRMGLELALAQFMESLRPRFPGLLTLDWRATQHLPGPVAVAFFDIAELALDNVLAHSGATRVKVVISGKGPVTMQIRDNGCGFDHAKPSRRGLGLLRMAAAARRIGATFIVESVAGRSTIVKLRYATPSPPRR